MSEQTQHRDYVASTRQSSGINPPCTAQVMPLCVHLSSVHILHGHCDGMNGEPLMAINRVQTHEMALTMHARMSVWLDMPILSGTPFSSSLGSSEAAADHMTPSLRGPEISEETTLTKTRCEASLASPVALQAQCMVRLSIDQTRRDIMDSVVGCGVCVCVTKGTAATTCSQDLFQSVAECIRDRTKTNGVERLQVMSSFLSHLSCSAFSVEGSLLLSTRTCASVCVCVCVSMSNGIGLCHPTCCPCTSQTCLWRK